MPGVRGFSAIIGKKYSHRGIFGIYTGPLRPVSIFLQASKGFHLSFQPCTEVPSEDDTFGVQVETLKPRLKDAKLDKRLMKEILVRLIYVEMLGHDASWGHVKALQACSTQHLQTKKVLALSPQVALILQRHLDNAGCTNCLLHKHEEMAGPVMLLAL